jgi:hypothetical protein
MEKTSLLEPGVDGRHVASLMGAGAKTGVS